MNLRLYAALRVVIVYTIRVKPLQIEFRVFTQPRPHSDDRSTSGNDGFMPTTERTGESGPERTAESGRIRDIHMPLDTRPRMTHFIRPGRSLATAIAIDSMAWDFAARRDHPVGRTMHLRAKYMFDWVARNQQAAGSCSNSHTPSLLLAEGEPVSGKVGEWRDLVASGGNRRPGCKVICDGQSGSRGPGPL